MVRDCQAYTLPLCANITRKCIFASPLAVGWRFLLNFFFVVKKIHWIKRVTEACYDKFCSNRCLILPPGVSLKMRVSPYVDNLYFLEKTGWMWSWDRTKRIGASRYRGSLWLTAFDLLGGYARREGEGMERWGERPHLFFYHHSPLVHKLWNQVDRGDSLTSLTCLLLVDTLYVLMC